MSLLTGPIVIDGVRWGFAAKGVPARASWRPEHVARRYDSGRVEIVEPRWRLAGSFGFEALSAADFAQLKGLTSRPFALVLRSRQPDDPSWPELEVQVRRTNDVEETSELYRRDAATGNVLYRATVEFESLAVVAEVPGTLDGGFEQTDTEAVQHAFAPGGSFTVYDVEPWGDATADVEAWTFDFEGQEFTLEFHELGPPPLAALVLEEIGLYHYDLDVSGTLRLGPRSAFETA